MILSCVIPARNEFPNIIHTVHSILASWEASGFDRRDIEIIIVDNCSTDDFYPQRGTKGTTSYLMPRGAYWEGLIRVVRDPIAGNHSARNKGAEVAHGEYLFFSDAHMAYSPFFFKHMVKAVKEAGGIVHAPIAWMGAYQSGIGYQYTIKLGEEIKGTWANYCLSQDDWWYIPALGHCSLIVRKDQFLNFGGYPQIHRTYGGGEFYLNMKWWMFGSTVAVEPRAVGYHLASGRGYTYSHGDYEHNVLNIGLQLGMDDWTERAYLNWLRNKNVETMKRVYAEAKIEAAQDRAFVEKRRVKSFNDMLCEQVEYDGKKWVGTWNKMNLERMGKCNGYISIFQDSWLPLVVGTPAEKEYPGEHQEALAKFIDEHLSDFVYKRIKVASAT